MPRFSEPKKCPLAKRFWLKIGCNINLARVKAIMSEHTRREFLGTTVAAGAAFALSSMPGSEASPAPTATLMPTQRSKALMALFALKYPIFEAPHGARNTTPELAIAVSKAGAMGALALTHHTPGCAGRWSANRAVLVGSAA